MHSMNLKISWNATWSHSLAESAVVGPFIFTAAASWLYIIQSHLPARYNALPISFLNMKLPSALPPRSPDFPLRTKPVDWIRCALPSLSFTAAVSISASVADVNFDTATADGALLETAVLGRFQIIQINCHLILIPLLNCCVVLKLLCCSI